MAATTEYIAVIPDDVSGSEHRYLRLPHPRSGMPQLYLPYANGICEVSKISGSKGRTWFIGDDKMAEGTMLMHNPIDPFFLAVPIALSLLPPGVRPAPFQPFADLLSTASGSAAFALKPAFSPNADPEQWNADMGRLVELKAFRRAFRACCDKKQVAAAPPSPSSDGGSPSQAIAYFRPSREAILRVLKAKVDNLANEDNFGKFDHLIRSLGRDGLLEPGVKEELVQAARTRAAIDQIAQYLPTPLTALLIGEYDLLALDAHLADRAAAARAAAVPIIQGSGKEKAGAKRKVATQSSRGVEALKKVRTEGMAKMTSFFKPKEKEKAKN